MSLGICSSCDRKNHDLDFSILLGYQTTNPQLSLQKNKREHWSLPEGMSRVRDHLDLQMALLYPASRSLSATNRSAQPRQPPPAARPEQEQTARICLTASSVSARIRVSAELVLASASYMPATTYAFVTARCMMGRNAAENEEINSSDIIKKSKP